MQQHQHMALTAAIAPARDCHTAEPRGASTSHGTGAITRLPLAPGNGWIPPMPNTAAPTEPPYLYDTLSRVYNSKYNNIIICHWEHYFYAKSVTHMIWLRDPTPSPLVCTALLSHPAGVSQPFAFAQFSHSVPPYFAML